MTSSSLVDGCRPPILPYAATWALPDLELLHSGLISVDRLPCRRRPGLDLLVVPATTLAALRQEEWDVPPAIEQLADVVALSRRADQAVARVAAATRR